MRNTQDATAGIIDLFNNEARQTEYDKIYDSGTKEVIVSQLKARLLLLRVFKGLYFPQESMQFNLGQKYKLFKQLRESAVSQVDDAYLVKLALEFTYTVQGADRLWDEIPNKTVIGFDGINKCAIIGTGATHPTANEIINLGSDLEKSNVVLAEALARTPKKLADGDILLKVNIKANPFDVLRGVYQLLLTLRASEESKEANRKNVINTDKLKENRYLEMCDILIFNTFYKHISEKYHIETQNEKVKLTEIYHNDFISFYKDCYAVNDIIKATIDQKYDGEFLEIYRKTFIKNIEPWIDDKNIFLKQMSELKITMT
ncbi:hypothetical protein [Paraglaciecola hydrolytica]|uniref:Uncharacterized protein n=1 Tax=Paraglaciecola hydrolytica TaxID=1799789 RepID=A0A148KLN7_9ALTE|nr:hypothetical protein [Paraglaciecola hydrolytica]KXI27207.1 hypothetical protein AX660_01170 [Paraglaciecola hydrolytica]